MSDSGESDSSLPASRLGTRHYWEECYDTELDNFNDFGDEGDVWFGSKVTNAIVTWIGDNVADRTAAVVDIGTGNGMLLIHLAKAGFCRLTGVDYVPQATQLAQGIAETHSVDRVIQFFAHDMLNGADGIATPNSPFHVAVDKGTYDAICLNPDTNLSEVKLKYKRSLTKMLKPSGIFVIASCNWTKEELVHDFVDNCEGQFHLRQQLETNSYTFGGKAGSNVTCLVLQRRDTVSGQ